MIIIVVILYVKIQRTNLSIYSSVKSIQSNLKHLSWVAQRVAAGDYKQHVSSLGRFSDSFNEMIDQLSHYREKMEHISNTDVLTGTANRRAFNQMIKKLWDKDIPCAIVFIDIDGLKYVNDNYGHSGGNRYIKEVCQILKMNLKEDEFIFRIGGDELLILSKKEDAHICEERLLEIRLQFREEMKKKIFVKAQIHGTYIVGEDDSGMYLIDQHAAQERINYEYFLEKYSHPDMTMRDLLVPITVEYPLSECMIIEERKDLLKSKGIEIIKRSWR